MESYIAFRFLVDAPHAHAIEPLFKHEHIGPVALGGLSGTDDIILAGWALEHLLTEYANDRTGGNCGAWSWRRPAKAMSCARRPGVATAPLTRRVTFRAVLAYVAPWPGTGAKDRGRRATVQRVAI